MSFITDNITVEGLSDTKTLRTQGLVQSATASTLSLTNNSEHLLIFTGTTPGQIVKLQDATTISLGYRQAIHNNTTQSLEVRDAGGNRLITLQPQERALAVLQTPGSVAGIWSIEFISVSNNSTNFSGAQEAFEDFMFDAYAGAGSNDNQYAFTAVLNSGSSDIDGGVSVVGNDYEGIHTLNSLASATSRPLVSAFNNVNRIALGLQQDQFEIRVRVPVLSTSLQTFTVRYGLMDVITIGQPSNGVLFSYTHGTNSGQWRGTTVSGSTATNVDSTATVVANTWYKLSVVINSSANLVDFFVDGVKIGTSSTNIPSGAAMALRYVFKLEKSVGTTSRTTDIDYIAWRRVR